MAKTQTISCEINSIQNLDKQKSKKCNTCCNYNILELSNGDFQSSNIPLIHGTLTLNSKDNKVTSSNCLDSNDTDESLNELAEKQDLDNNADNADSATGRIGVLPAANTNQPTVQVDNMSVNNSTTTPKKGVCPQENFDLQNPSLYVTQELINIHLRPLADSRDTWIGIGAALKDEYGDDALRVWLDWSSSHPDYDEKQSKNQWKSFGKSYNKTFGYIVNQAKLTGVDYAAFLREQSDIENRPYSPNKPTPKKAPPSTKENKKASQYQENKAMLSRFTPIFKTLTDATINHPYFQSKGVNKTLLNIKVTHQRIDLINGQYIPENSLVIPVKDYLTGKVTGYQYINQDGRKLIVGGSQLAGAAYVFKGNRSKLILSEGIATAYTIRQSSQYETLCCLNKYSLKTTVLQLIEKGFDPENIILAFDHDEQKGAGKTAQETGQELARKYGFKLLVPKKIGDWNDHGIEACKAEINQTIPHQKTKLNKLFRSQYIGEALQEFIDNNIVSIIKSDMGTGKTFSIKLYLKSFLEQYGRMPNLIYISPLIRLNEQMVKDINKFTRDELGFNGNYMSFYKNIIKEINIDIKADMARCCATTMQSSEKVFSALIDDIDLLLVDESESVSSSLISDVVKLKVKVVESLKKIGSRSKNVVLFDADAGDLSRKLAKIFKPSNKAAFYENTYRSQSGFNVQVIDTGTDATRLSFIEQIIIDRYRTKERYQVIPVFCMTKSEANSLGAMLLDMHDGVRILMVTGGDSTELSKVLEDKELIRQYDYFIYTTAAGTGVSFDQNNLFTETYCIAVNKIKTAGINSLTQGSYRIRNPLNNTIVFLLPSDKKINASLPNGIKELRRELEDDADNKVESLKENTNYEHGETQKWLIDLKTIGGAEFADDKNRFSEKLIEKLKASEMIVKSVDVSYLQVDEAAGLAKKEANKLIKEIREKALTSTEQLTDDQVKETKTKTMHGIKISHKDETLLLKDTVVNKTELSYEKYNEMVNSDKLELVKEFQRGMIKKAENIEASGNTRKANIAIVNTDFENVGFDPLTDVSRLIEAPKIMRKVEDLSFKESISSDYFTTKPAKLWLTRNIKTIKLMGLTCTKIGIMKNPELIYKNLIVIMGYELKTMKQRRSKGKVNRSKVIEKTVKLNKNQTIFDLVDRRDLEGSGITNYSVDARGAKSNMITTGGKSSGWSPVVIDKTKHRRVKANLIINIETNAPAQIWANPSHSLKSDRNPVHYPSRK